jgi:putative DNA primase/helicase
VNQIDIINQFVEAMRGLGVRPKKLPRGTGKIERFPLEDDRPGELTGWAVLYMDGIPSGAFGNWRTGEKHQWCSKDRSTLTQAEQFSVARLLAESEAKRSREQARLQKIAASKAVELLATAEPANDHPYLQTKRVGAYGARKLADDLLISIQDNQITSLQRIGPDGSKRFLPGGRVAGCFHLFGKPDGLTYLTEGWATGATIHALTGRPVVVAFNAGNLLPVARSIRERYPTARPVCAADNDSWGIKNAGLEAARSLEPLGIPYVLPNFSPCDVKPTDFNDLFVLEGEDVARNQLTPSVIPDVEHMPVVSAVSEQWICLPDVKGNNQTPVSTIANLTEVLRRSEVTVRYNVISKQEEILIPGEQYTMDNKANASLAWIESRCANYNMPTEKVGQFLTHIADQNQYNPVATWIESKPWDGTSRLAEFYRTVRVVDEESDEYIRDYKKTVMRRWLVSAVAAAYRPNGIASQGVLVFQGDQSIGKTTWFKRLCPSELRSDGVTLDLRDKDSQFNALSYWLVELGELDATFRRSDIAQLKSFITRDKDVMRLAYAKRKSEFPRRTVFFASVNSENFLHDDTGNRRFWVLPCDSINYMHRIDMQQLWAEVLDLYRAGERWTLSAEELLDVNAYNRSHEVIDPIEEMIRSELRWDQDSSLWTFKTATKVLMDIGISQPSNAQARKASEVIKKLNGKRQRRTSFERLLAVPT